MAKTPTPTKAVPADVVETAPVSAPVVDGAAAQPEPDPAAPAPSSDPAQPQPAPVEPSSDPAQTKAEDEFVDLADDEEHEHEPVANGLGADVDDPTIDVETKGEYMLLDPTTGDIVKHEGVSTVKRSSWILNAIASGQLKEA